MKMPLTEQIQSVIIATQNYKRFIASHNRVKPNTHYNWYKLTYSYYSSLPLPDGLNISAACFNAVLLYPIEQTTNTEMNYLPKTFEFGY